MKKFMTVFTALILSIFIAPNVVSASSNFDGMLNDGVITLSEDVILSEKYVINEGEMITIDLNGHTLTGPSDNYAIENKGNLKIVDSGLVKGKIFCPSSSSSCVRNLDKLKVDGVTIESAFVAIKNDVEGNFYGDLTVENATISSSYAKTDTGTIMNWGKATVTNSRVNASASGVAVYATSGSTAGKNSEINLVSNIIEGKYSIYGMNYQSSDGTTQTINVEGGQLNGNISAMASRGSSVSIKGKVATTDTALSNVLSFADEGAEIILTSDLTNKKITVPEGVTLNIQEGVTFTVSSSRQLIVNGDLKVNGTLDAVAYVEEANVYFGSLNYAIKTIGINADTVANGHTVTVLKDIKETTAIKPSTNKNITLDLNGYSVNADITVPATTKMTFKDSSEDEAGNYTGTITNEGTVTIESGKYTNVPVTLDGATTTLEGGTYPIEDMENVIIPDDKEVVKNEDGTYSIISKEVETPSEDNSKQEDVKDEAVNPKTSDNIILYVIVGMVSIVCIGASGFVLKKIKA